MTCVLHPRTGVRIETPYALAPAAAFAWLHPRTGVRIETTSQRRRPGKTLVTPRSGVRIETAGEVDLLRNVRYTPLGCMN